MQPDTVSVIGQGGVLGLGDLDLNISSKPNYWILAKTDMEILRLPRDRFLQFWQGQIKFEWDYKYNFLRTLLIQNFFTVVEEKIYE